MQAEQRLLKAHQVLIFQHPFYWYSCPALLKEWQDLVLTQGYAYAASADNRLPVTELLSVITCGGSLSSYQRGGYNQYSIREFLLPFEQTATLCGMRYLPPFVVDAIHKNESQARLERFAEQYRQLLLQLQQGPLNTDQMSRSYLSEPVGG